MLSKSDRMGNFMVKKDVETIKEEINYGQVIENAFSSNDWHFNVKKFEDRTIFALPMSAKNCPCLNVKFEIAAKGDSKIRCYLAEDTPKSKRLELLAVVNTLNSKYRYVTVSLDSDGDILAAYDFTIFGTDETVIEKQVVTMVVLLSDIMDKCIPPIMKVVWSAEEDDEEEE